MMFILLGLSIGALLIGIATKNDNNFEYREQSFGFTLVGVIGITASCVGIILFWSLGLEVE